MKKFIFTLYLSFIIFSCLYGQDTLVGWTFPAGTKNNLANLGNVRNVNGMYIEGAISDGTLFDTIRFYEKGYTTLAASANRWDSGANNKTWEFSVDASGYGNIKFYAQISSDSNFPGPRDFKLQYRIGCCSPTWMDLAQYPPIRVGLDWNTGFINGALLPDAVDNMIGLQIRLMCTSDTSVSGTILNYKGISLMDDIIITGTKLSSIEPLSSPTELSIYPNPGNGIFNIKTTILLKKIIINNSIGKEVLIIDNPRKDEHINLSAYPKGIYLIQGFIDKNIFPVKIILN